MELKVHILENSFKETAQFIREGIRSFNREKLNAAGQELVLGIGPTENEIKGGTNSNCAKRHTPRRHYLATK